MRGTLVSWNQFAIIFGQLVVYFVNFLILGEHTQPVIEKISETIYQVSSQSDQWTITTGWRYMFGSEAFVAGIFTILVCLVPESPRYLALVGKDEKLSMYSLISTDMRKPRRYSGRSKETTEVKSEKLFSFGVMVIFVGVMLSVFQQAVGINAVLYYAPRIFESMGMSDPMMNTVYMGIVNITFTLVAVFTVEARSQAAPHLGFDRHGYRSNGCRTQQPYRRCAPDIPGSVNNGILGFVHVLMGTHLLGAHRRDFPQHYPFGSRGYSRGFPVDIQLYRIFDVCTYVQYVARRYGRPFRTHVCLRALRCDMHRGRVVCLFARA